MKSNFLIVILLLSVLLYSCNNKNSYAYQDAEFPGGYPGIAEFVQENIVYPESAVDKGVEGTCYIQFVVTKNGKVRSLRMQKGIKSCPECNQEAMNVIRKMPDWEPAKAYGKNVNSFYSLPINFALE